MSLKTQTIQNTLIRSIIPIVIISFVSRVGANIFIPALPEITNDLNLTPSAASGTITIYFFILSISCLLVGAFIDFFNKKRLLIYGGIFTIIGSLLCGLSFNELMIMVGRGVQAFGGAIILIASQTMLGKISSTKNIVRVFAYFSLALSIAPLLAPTFGGFITEYLQWRYNFYFIILISIIALFLLFATGKDNGQEDVVRCGKPKLNNIFSGYFSLFKSLKFIAIIGTSLICYFFQGGFMAYSSFLFIDHFGLSPDTFGLLSIPIVVGLILGRFPTIFLEKRYGVLTTYKFNSGVIIASMLFSLIYYIIVGHHTVVELLIVLSIFNIGFSGHVILSMSSAMLIFKEQKGQVSASLNFLNQTFSYLAALLVQLLLLFNVSFEMNYNIFAIIIIISILILYKIRGYYS